MGYVQMPKILKYILFSSAIIAAPAWAQDADDSSNYPFTVAEGEREIVVVASGVSQSPNQIGQAVTVIRRDEIERRQTVAIADVLATTPGVTATRNGGLGGFSAVRIRGGEGEQTLVLIDGVRVNDPSSPGGGFDFGTLLSGSIARVEVLRGPNSVPWGSQAIGGVINIVTAPPTERTSVHGSVEAGYAGTVFANAGAEGKVGPVSAALTAGYLSTDGISAAASGTERDGYRQIGGSGRVSVELSGTASIDLRAYYAHSHTNLDGFPPPTYSFADTPEFSTSQEIYGYAGLNLDLLHRHWRNKLAATIADINRDNYDPTYGTVPSFIGRGRSERYSYQGDIDIAPRVRVVIGAEHEESRFSDDSQYARTGITSGYAEAIVRPIDPLTITGGVRYDSHRTFGGHVTFGANAALALRSGTTIRASYGEGFKAPTLYQLYSFYGTIGLQPETARNFDVGVEQRLWNNSVRASATYFHRDTKNQIDFDLGTFTYQNIAAARAQGVELELEVRPITSLTLTANYSFIDAINRSTGANFNNQLARRPRHTFSFSGDYRFPFGLSVGSTISHVGDSFDDAGNTRRLNGYVLLGLRAEMPVGQHLSIYGRIDNLTDERYQVVSGYGTYGRAAYGGVRVRL